MEITRVLKIKAMSSSQIEGLHTAKDSHSHCSTISVQLQYNCQSGMSMIVAERSHHEYLSNVTSSNDMVIIDSRGGGDCMFMLVNVYCSNMVRTILEMQPRWNWKHILQNTAVN